MMAKSGANTVSYDEEWRARDDCETLKRAQEIIDDPKRMKAAKKYAEKEAQRLEAVKKGLRGT